MCYLGVGLNQTYTQAPLLFHTRRAESLSGASLEEKKMDSKVETLELEIIYKLIAFLVFSTFVALTLLGVMNAWP